MAGILSDLMKTYLFNIHDIVLIMTMSQCLILALLQSLIPSQNRVSHHLLTLFFVMIFINTGGILLLWDEALQTLNLHSLYLLPLALGISYTLKGPVLYFYLRSICEPSFRFRYRHLLHLLPTVLALISIPTFGIKGYDLLAVEDATKDIVVLCLWTGFRLSPVVYAIVSAYTVRHVGDTLRNHYSDVSDVGTNWINILVIGYLIHWAWSLFTHIVGNVASENLSDAFGIANNYLSFIMVNILLVYSLLYARRLLIASFADQRCKTESEHLSGEGDKDKKLGSNGKPSQEVIDKVLSGIVNKKLYLEHSINVEQFAQRVGLGSRDASHAINTHFNSNFFEFINRHRVEEAQRLLSSKQHMDESILDILYKSGFNSKSAFHRYFKRLSGMSPTEYRKQAQSS